MSAPAARVDFLDRDARLVLYRMQQRLGRRGLISCFAVGAAACAVAFTVAFTVAAATPAAAPAAPAAAPAPAPARDSYRMAAWPATAASPEFHLLDGDGHGRSLNDYRGHVVVVFFGFTHCPDFCPTELLRLQQSLKRIPGVRAKIQVLFITLNPERDTAALLKQYVAAFDPTFVGLTGTPQNIAQAARNFGVEYARVAMGRDYTIDHSASIYLFDQNGILRLIGSGATSNADFDHDLELLAEESASR